ncbi:hypothetical protein D3C77_482990 [compost metagenome]
MVRLVITAKHLEQPLNAKQLVAFVTGIDHPVRQQQQALAQGQGQDLRRVIETLRCQHAQRQVPGHQRQWLTALCRQQVAIRHTAVPDLDHAPLETQI